MALGAILGLAGQAFRIIVGLKKPSDDASEGAEEAGHAGNRSLKEQKKIEYDKKFEPKKLQKSTALSLVVGVIAGIMASVDVLGTAVSRELILSIVAAGYAGSDFVEGMMSK